MTDATVTEIAQWYAASQEASAAFLRMMRLRLADAPDRAEALYVAHRLAPEDVTAEELAAMWLVTAADLIDTQAEVERLRLHSTWLNTISFKIAEALGEVPEGAAAVEANLVEQAERLIAQLAEEKSRRRLEHEQRLAGGGR